MMSRPLLVLDLDETLVHTHLSPDHCENPTYEFTGEFMSSQYHIYTSTRPYLNNFLETMSKLYDIVIFTASQKVYADTILDTIDPSGRLFKKRYYQEHWIKSGDFYIKNLDILGHDLARTVLIDDEPHLPVTQVDNVIKIKEWINDPNDTELKDLIPMLTRLASTSDVRKIINHNWHYIRLLMSRIMNFF